MENKKTKIISIVALVALALTVITATYAYFQAQTGEGSQTDIKINANTVDTFTFETGSAINLSLDQTSFASGKGNITGGTYASAKLTANNKTNNATNNYNLYLNISDNNFGYTRNSSYPEILLTIKDASNNEITSISGLEYKTVTDGKGASISGFDITTKTGLITLFNNREITTTSTKTDTWNITATFVNYNADQSKNAGKSFSGQVLISKDSFDDYTPNTINTLSATKSGTNLTVNLNVEQGSNEIDKYYYAIEESNGIAMLSNNTHKVQRLSNKLAANTLTYVESTSSSYTFTNLSASKDYKVSAYVVDKKKLKSNTYEYNYYSDSYVYPVINKVETSTTSNSITVKVTATKGTNNISKYYYSVDGGNTFVESTSNSYTFIGLQFGNYKIIVKIMDNNGKYSNIFVKTITVDDIITFKLENIEHNAKNGMSFQDWLDSKYNTFGYIFNKVMKGNYEYDVNNLIIESGVSYKFSDDRYFRLIVAEDSGGNSFLINKVWYTEEYLIYNPNINGSLLYDSAEMSKIANKILNNSKFYSSSLPFTLKSNVATSSITFPLSITFTNASGSSTLVLLHYTNETWQAENVVLSTDMSSFTITLTSLNEHDAYVILYE